MPEPHIPADLAARYAAAVAITNDPTQANETAEEVRALIERIGRLEADYAECDESAASLRMRVERLTQANIERGKRLERAVSLMRECVDPRWKTPAELTVEHVREFLAELEPKQ